MSEEFFGEEARLCDLEAVLDINRDVYDGFDYLPGRWSHFFHSRKHKLFVARRRGTNEIVSENI